jgi:Protein of unknown function (DUF3305)
MAADKIDLGVVLERRETSNKWIDHSWHLVGVFPGAGPARDWLELARGEGWVRYHAATLPIEIFSGETEGYKYNLSLDPPIVFVVLDPDADGPHEIEPSLVTVCPYEAQDYLDASENEVQNTPMPPQVVSWLTAFVEKHHVDVPFKKRKRTPHPDKKPPINELILPGAGPRGNGSG